MTAVVMSVALDRTSLTLSALTAGAYSPSASFWLPEEGIEWPRFPRRKQRSPASPYLEGDGTLLAKVRGMGTFPLTVYAAGSTTAAVRAAMVELQTAVDQWSYALTLTVDGAATSLTAECVDDEIQWGPIDSGMVRAHFARGSVAIPLYPS